MSALADAEAELRKFLADPPYSETGAWRWERPKSVRFQKLLATLPAGLPPSLIDALFAAYFVRSSLIDLHDLPAHLDDWIVAHVEARGGVDAAFILRALELGRGDRHALLEELLYLAHFLPRAGRANRTHSAALAARPEILEAAQVAVALEGIGLPESSRYVPILAADASPGSLDLLLPIIEAARADGDFDWIQKDLLPLFPDTPHVRAIVAGLVEAKTERASASPARAFVEKLGMRAPAHVKITVTFKDAAGAVTYALRIDSARGGGFEGRRNAKWQWNGVAPGAIKKHVPATTVAYVLRASAGLDRAKLDAWARKFLPG